MAARFARPVYLCGSALLLPDPRDVDVRIVVTDDEFRARYGDPDAWGRALWWPSKHDGSLRYAADMADLAREAALVLRLNLDVCVQPVSEAARYADQPRQRLDDVPGVVDVN